MRTLILDFCEQTPTIKSFIHHIVMSRRSPCFYYTYYTYYAYVDIRTILCPWVCCSVVKSLSDHTNVPNYFALGAPPLSLMVLMPLALIVVFLPVEVVRVLLTVTCRC